MTLSIIEVAIICVSYISLLCAIAYITEKGWISNKIVSHPIIYIFSLGIFASAWSFYGVIDLAKQYGYGALSYYLGTGALFLFAPIALKPLIEVARRFQINSMADLLTFRYDSHSVGALVTLLMLLGMAPLLTLQIQAVADTIQILTTEASKVDWRRGAEYKSRELLAFMYCIVIAGFTMLFGSNREHHKGLITAMAFESLVKLFGLLAIGGYVLFSIFGGLSGIDEWLLNNPEQASNLYARNQKSSSHTLLLVFIATAVAMPHIFHMTVVENHVVNATRTVTWAFPLFLLAMAIPVFPILWAGIDQKIDIPAEYYPLAIPVVTGSKTFAIIAFVAGLSAASGAIIAIALSLATMILNHWILPKISLQTKHAIYNQLIWMKRILIAVVILSGYLFYLILNNNFSLTELALCAFIATLQFLPGIIAVVHWSRGNVKGLIAGLAVGVSFWFIALFIPLLIGVTSYSISFIGLSFSIGIEHWNNVTLWSLGLNTIIFIMVSMNTEQTPAERYSAELCSEDELSHPLRSTLNLRSPNEMIERLSERIGATTARTEVKKALKSLSLQPNESRPYALRRLRDEIEANLAGLMGISMANEIINRQVPFSIPAPGSEVSTDINLMESRLGQFRSHLTGLAAELNNLRLYHRKTLEQLPLPVFSIGQDLEVMMWNEEMHQLSSIPSDTVIGSHLKDVKNPWGALLHRFACSDDAHFYKQEVLLNGRQTWINLHQASIHSSTNEQQEGQVIILEDVSALQTLEQELIHSERLASVGRLAAGVAHEIGNPVTGIACLAQNMKYETENPDILEAANQILSQTDRVSRIVHSLVSFSHSGRRNGQPFQKTQLKECAQEAINLLSLQVEKHAVIFNNQLTEDLLISGDSQRLIQIFINLLSNSRDASPQGASIIIDGEHTSGGVLVKVTDEGCGIPDEIKNRIIEPFFTTKEPGEGTGLGLAMVYSIVEEHQGSMEIISPVNETLKTGTQFLIKFATTHKPG